VEVQSDWQVILNRQGAYWMQVQHTSLWLGLPDLQTINVTEAVDGTLLVWVQGTATGAVCPSCGAWADRVHQRRRQAVNDLPAHGHPVLLLLTRRRWRCGNCDHVFGESLPSVGRYQRMTMRYEAALYRGLRRRPTTAVAQEEQLSPSRLQRILERRGDEEVAARPPAVPRLLGVDEFAAKRGHVYNTVFADLETHRIVEIVETREIKPVREYLKTLATTVEAVAIDLSEPFRKAVRQALPDVMIVADKFHVIRLAQWGLNAVRRRVRKALHGDRSHAIWRKRWVLLRNFEDVSTSQRPHLFGLLQLSRELRLMYAAKECLRRWYRTCTPENAVSRLDRLLGHWVTSMVPELQKLAITFRYWQTEICNYASVRISNSITEGLNNKIKVTKRQAYGFRSFTNFRRKILLAT
jgi:transposase